MADIEVMEQVKDEKPELQGTAITRAELAELQKNPTVFKALERIIKAGE